MAFSLVHSFDGDAGRFKIVDKRLLGTETLLPVADWIIQGTTELLPAASFLLGLLEDEGNGVRIDAGQVVVPHGLIAALDVATAERLRLPKVVPYLLDLQHEGRLDEQNFYFRVQWRDAGQRPVVGAKRTGAFLTVGKHTYRVPDPQYTLVSSAEQFNAAPPDSKDSRLAFWSRMRPLLPEDTQSSVLVSGYLRQTRIAHATRFSLVLKKSAAGFTFDPILFGEAATADDSEPLHEIESILPPAQQRVFAEQRFPSHRKARGRYALDAGWYVILSEDVQKALDIVRNAQQADQSTRWAFARNPRAFIRKAFADEAPEEQVSSLFVETFEYSARVRGEGLWEHVVLPWVKRPTEDWLPAEAFGIRVDGQTIPIAAADLPALTHQIKQAIGLHEPIVDFGGHAIPANQATLDALAKLIGIVQPRANDSPESLSTDVSEQKQRVVLLISTHHNEVDFLRAVSPRFTSLPDGIPSLVKTALKPHQVSGLAWFQQAWRAGMPGALLADDMGLGKTLQTLAFLAWRRQDLSKRVHRPMLVVAPTALLRTWEQEATTHLSEPQLGTLLNAYGFSLRRLREGSGDELQLGRSLLDVRQIQSAHWVLTTYETMRDYQHSFASVRFDTVVLDEIQKIKTPGTLITHAAKALNGDFFVGLSGTPVENRLADLWCVVDATYPGYLGDLATFSSKYEVEIQPEHMKSLKASLTESKPPAPPLMLRRMKTDHLPGLPNKHEHVITEIMPPLQARAYADAVERATTGDGKQAILQTLHQIRSISLHPLHPDHDISADYPLQSARLKVALGVLDKIADSGEKALIFLESREMQRYLSGFLQRRYSLPHLPLQINGAVNGPERQNRVNTFQRRERGFDVMILSPRAGGVGLTLTSANHVIHLSRWWNPAVEDQCSDRVFRIGQLKDVHIYYPQAIHPDFRDRSFDLTLHALLSRKRQLCVDLLMPPGGSEKDIRDLYEQSVSQRSPKSQPGSSLNLQDIDVMEPTQFEDWALTRLRKAGYTVFKTPWSHDCGGDGIGRKDGHHDIVIQCKHSQLRTPIPSNVVDQLLRAKKAYGSNSPVLVAITNSDNFTGDAVTLAKQHGVLLLSRAELSKWPDILH